VRGTVAVAVIDNIYTHQKGRKYTLIPEKFKPWDSPAGSGVPGQHFIPGCVLIGGGHPWMPRFFPEFGQITAPIRTAYLLFHPNQCTAMPGLSLFEIAIVVLVLIIFVRPEDLPKLVRYAGRLYGDLQRQLNHFKHLTRDAMDELRNDQVEPPRRPVETISRTAEHDADPADEPDAEHDADPADEPDAEHDADPADEPADTAPGKASETAEVNSADTPDSKTSSAPP
jgi:Sec-independent protein translocase protein TatA